MHLPVDSACALCTRHRRPPPHPHPHHKFNLLAWLLLSSRPMFLLQMIHTSCTSWASSITPPLIGRTQRIISYRCARRTSTTTFHAARLALSPCSLLMLPNGARPSSLQVARHPGDYDDATREPSIFNLAHTYRKMKRLDEAIEWYRAALAIHPHSASTYSALGFTYAPPCYTPDSHRPDLRVCSFPIAPSPRCVELHHEISARSAGSSNFHAFGRSHHLRGDVDLAIELYHQSLSLKPDDTFTSEMLTQALKDTIDEPLSLLGAPVAPIAGLGRDGKAASAIRKGLGMPSRVGEGTISMDTSAA